MTTKKTTNSEEESSAKKKPAAKKTAAKTTAKKTTAKKTASKTTAAKKTTAKKTTAKTTAAKKTTAKKTVKKVASAEQEAPQTQPVQDVQPAKESPVSATQPVVKPAQPQAAQPAPAQAPQAVSQPKPAQPQVQPKPVPQPAQPQVQPKPASQPAQPVSQPKPAPTHPQGPRHGHHHGEQQAPKQPERDPKCIRIVGQPTVKELAEKMNFKTNDFIKKLMMMGIFATINQRLEKDMIELIVDECGFKAEMAEEDLDKETVALMETPDDPASLKPRSPVITIMGHVDHGKTSLLDAIRKSNVAAGEEGAITQHIGAYRVTTPRGTLTFLDTPGHEAFTAMRARGAQATDIVVLVVSATDGIMPQTIEAMEHAKAAGAPIIVAINKIDLPGANPDRVKQDLAARGLVPEEWQGNTIFVEISAKKHINIDKLLEMISLQAEMMELKANPDRPGVGVILESKRDNKRGVVATVLVQKGTMKVGDPFIVGTNYGRIRALIDENSQRYQKIGPSTPAEILGINGEPPQVGDTLYIMPSEKEARYAAEKRKLAQKEDSQAHRKQMSLMSLGKNDENGNRVKKLQLILKADVQGSIEAIKDALLRIPSDEVELDIILSAPGNINESDILLAKASNAVVIGFHVDVENKAQAEAEREGIEIRRYTIIFELLEDIKAAMEGLLEPDVVETVVGTATIKKVMKLSSGLISGSLVESGTIIRGYEVRIKRNGQEVGHGKIGGLKRFKDDVKEVEKGYECGILVEGFKGVAEGDTIECFRKDNVTRRIKM
ncbi:translation initiation factor IF-2 [Candidatus Avelusimicrobium gallicola]|uniref:Translation initiation factor IF-2 n=1 Tax=Candidatus Avelusimicrobium gallicola TaxID=2562704 RepID=A0A1Y4DKT1_9BACT|nr:translation initiation factor IF-2 [Elusimicrobium sp. An273]OUO56910.1 translation initiation factor IF-2 [Elusimicrobium sp. An273]